MLAIDAAVESAFRERAFLLFAVLVVVILLHSRRLGLLPMHGFEDWMLLGDEYCLVRWLGDDIIESTSIECSFDSGGGDSAFVVDGPNQLYSNWELDFGSPSAA